eukprot:5559123-Alexandrium_andersonii.AAC.1
MAVAHHAFPLGPEPLWPQRPSAQSGTARPLETHPPQGRCSVPLAQQWSPCPVAARQLSISGWPGQPPA